MCNIIRKPISKLRLQNDTISSFCCPCFCLTRFLVQWALFQCTVLLLVYYCNAQYVTTLLPNNPSSGFGTSVSISGDTIVVGDISDPSNATGVNGDQDNIDAPDSGAAYVFVRNGTTWTQQAYLKPSNTGTTDLFGISVSISGDTIVVGAYYEDSNATGVNGDQDNDDAENSGAAYVFVREGTAWTQQAYLKASNTGAYDQFGYSVSISGDTIVVGKRWELDVFVRDRSTWEHRVYLGKNDTNFGAAVAADEYIVVGAAGSASVFSGIISITGTTGTSETTLPGTTGMSVITGTTRSIGTTSAIGTTRATGTTVAVITTGTTSNVLEESGRCYLFL
jgi:hypothetical protein